ncbi:MAG: serine hydrolase [Caulobacter sp.]|nr:serine hydrolase [Caulobacter sp.]
MSGFLTRRGTLAGLGGAGALLTARPGWSAETDVSRYESLITRTMEAFGQPGLGVAIVHHGKPILVKGYGVRRLGAPEPVDEATLFSIASNSKAYTAASLALLVEAGKLGWDDPVVKHLPEFAMYDPYVTAHMTVRDLLVHRSGLSLGQGDLMIWPSTSHTTAELIAGLRYLKPAREFRYGYAYDNVLYVVAGEVVARVSGMSWEDFVVSRIFQPLGMTDSVPSFDRLVGKTNVASPHARVSGPVRGVGPLSPIKSDDFRNASPAAGLQVSARDSVKWIQAQLARGALPRRGRLFSKASSEEMWKGQTIVAESEGPTADDPNRAFVYLYALGWGVSDFRGRKLISHTGAVSGQISVTCLLPTENFGFTVWTNAEEGGVLRTLRYGLLDLALGRDDYDWLETSRKRQAKLAADNTVALPARPRKPAAPSLPLSAYAGVYRDPWYGTVTITTDGDGLALSFDKSHNMSGPLEPWDGEVFKTRFTNRNIEDALVTFETDGKTVTRMTMKPYSPSADFSFDYQDLDFRPQRP